MTQLHVNLPLREPRVKDRTSATMTSYSNNYNPYSTTSYGANGATGGGGFYGGGGGGGSAFGEAGVSSSPGSASKVCHLALELDSSHRNFPTCT